VQSLCAASAINGNLALNRLVQLTNGSAHECGPERGLGSERTHTDGKDRSHAIRATRNEPSEPGEHVPPT
ncbi:MAG TPA: hypothetical protein VF821_31230, partial [Lentzea sp.]